jgi:hypothetical protein
MEVARMSRGISLLEDTFPAAPASGIVPRRVVVMDAVNRGDVKLPASPPEPTGVGASVETVSPANSLAVQLAGVAVLESDGSAIINPGDYLVASGTTGQVKTQAIAVPASPGVQANWNLYNIIGMCVDEGQIAAVAGMPVAVRLGLFVIFAA